MSNLLLSYTSRSDASTLSGGSWAVAYPLANVKTTSLQKTARTYGTKNSQTRFRCAFTANYTVRTLALVNHNLSSAGKWRVRAGRAPLDLLFDSDTIDDRITFSGGWYGTRVNKVGLIQPSLRTNWALQTQMFDNATWVKSATTVTLNTVAGPFDPTGTSTADSLVETVANAQHNLNQVINCVAGTFYTFSVYVKAGLRNKVTINFGDGAANIWGIFDLSAVTAKAGPSYTGRGQTIESVGRGWFRCSVTGDAHNTTAGNFSIWPMLPDDTYTYVGSTASAALYLWGAQMEYGPFVTDYIPTAIAAVSVADPRIDYDPRNRVTNLLLWSQDIKRWTFFSCSLVSNNVVAPDGTATAISMAVSGANSYTYQSLTVLPGTYTASVWLRSAVGGTAVIHHYAISDGTWGDSPPFAMTTEWKRFTWTFTTSGGVGSCQIGIGRSTYGGGTATTFDVWGAQLVMGRIPGAYVPTSSVVASAYQDFGAVRTNLLPYSQEFDKWNRAGETGGSIAANTIVAPDGSSTADAYTRAASSSNFAFLINTPGGDASRQLTFSVWAKLPAGTDNFYLCISDVSVRTAQSPAFSLSTTWQQISFTVSKNQLNNTGYLGTGFAGLSTNAVVHLWGAQLEEGAVATDYIQTFNAANTSPEGCRGLLVEEARTSPLLRSQEFANGSWNVGNCTITTGAISGPDGGSTGSLVTVTATTYTSLYQVLAATAISHTESIYIKRGFRPDFVIGLYNNTTAAGLVFLNYTWGTGVASFTGTGSYTITEAGDGWFRFSVTATAGITIGNSLNIYAGASGGSCTAGDTWYVFGAQFEAGAFASTYIPTTGAPVTRTAESVAITSTNFSGFITQGVGTMYGEAQLRSRVAGISQGVFSLSDNGGSNAISIFATAPTSVTAEVARGGIVETNIVFTESNQTSRVAIAYQLNDVVAGANGVLSAIDSTSTIPLVVNALYIGNVYGPYYYANGHIKRLTYWPTRLTDVELQTITTSGPDALGFNSGWANALQLTFKGDEPASWGSRYALIQTFAATTVRYVSVEFDDLTNASGYLEFGRLFSANAFQPTVNAIYGIKSGMRELSTTITAPSGEKYFNKQPRLRTETFELRYLKQAEANKIHELQQEASVVNEVLYVPNPADAAFSQRYGFLGRLTELGPIDYPIVLTRAVPFNMEEKA